MTSTNPNSDQFRTAAVGVQAGDSLGASSVSQGGPVPALAHIDLDVLRKTAEAATPGPWRIYRGDANEGRGAAVETEWAHDEAGEDTEPVTDWCVTGDAAHIAAFDPPTAIALLDRIKELEAMFLDKFARHEGAKMRAVTAEATIARVQEANQELSAEAEWALEMPNSGSINSVARATRGGTLQEATRRMDRALDGEA